MKIIIAGGGIGGLSTALALHKKGIDVAVYEAVKEIQPLGVGINILPHGVKCLSELGVLDDLLEVAIQTKELFYLNKFGQEVWYEKKGLDAGFNFAQLSVLRGDLQFTLLKAATERLGQDHIITGHQFTDFEHASNGKIICSFLDRNNDDRTVQVEADILIGADGIHSAVRRKLYPDEGSPKWAGQLMWRGVSEAEPFLTGQTMFMAGASSWKFIAYPVSKKHADRGSSLINWIAEVAFDPNDSFRKEDWNRLGKIEEFLPKYEDWDFGWINIPDLIRKASIVHEFPMVDRDPLERWSFGGVTLLGDAAHPMYPNGSNGASSAIVDALTIAEAIDTYSDPVEALAAYENTRRPATTKIVELNRKRGPEEVLEIADQRAPNGFEKIEDIIPRAELEAIAERYRRVGGLNIAQKTDGKNRAAAHGTEMKSVYLLEEK